MTYLLKSDSEIHSVIENEKKRQREQLVMIASENYTSSAVLEATGSILTNKYSEGYPGKRYYAGCENVDISESLAIERAKTLFNAESANVQAHSGSQANMAAFFAMCNAGDKIMGMSLDHGGQAPTALRYIEWLLTFPLTILTFYVMLKSVTDVKRGMFWRLLVGTLVWVIAQLLGAYGYMSVTLGFLVGIVGWLYIIGELYMGDTGRKNASCGNESVQMAFFANRLIITIGFSIYHIGYFIEHLAGGANINSLNVIYNLADFLNKIIFGMIIYSAAIQDTRKGKQI